MLPRLLTAAVAAAVLFPAHALAVTKIACAGEHSTQSAYVLDPDEYPALLQNLLGADYLVGNFGYRRATVQLDGPSLYPASTPYLQTVEYQQSLAFDPDIVILGPFGMHDCNSVYTDAGSINPANFTSGLDAIAAAYLGLAHKPKVYLALPIPYSAGDGVGVMREVVFPITHQIAQKYALAEIDFWTPNLGRGDLFYNPDHFTDAGIQRMALTACAGLGLCDAGALSSPDAGAPDAGASDAGPLDAGGPQPDAGAPDAGVVQRASGGGCGCASGPSGLEALAGFFALGLALRRRS